MIWDFCAWVGIATLTVLALLLVRSVVTDFLVSRVGWTKMERMGRWRALVLALTTGPPWRIL